MSPVFISIMDVLITTPKTQQVKAAHVDYLTVWMVWESRHSLSGSSSSGVSSATGKVRQLGGSLPKAPLDQGPGASEIWLCSAQRQAWGKRVQSFQGIVGTQVLCSHLRCPLLPQPF